MRHVMAPLLATAVVMALPSVAAADKTPIRASFAAKAIWVSPAQIDLEVRVKCEEGELYSLTVDVFQQMWGFGQVSGQCTGDNQYVTVPVYSYVPPWQLGAADAYLNFSTSSFFDSTARAIRIE